MVRRDRIVAGRGVSAELSARVDSSQCKRQPAPIWMGESARPVGLHLGGEASSVVGDGLGSWGRGCADLGLFPQTRVGAKPPQPPARRGSATDSACTTGQQGGVVHVERRSVASHGSRSLVDYEHFETIG
jgi:hypothetical protein